MRSDEVYGEHVSPRPVEEPMPSYLSRDDY